MKLAIAISFLLSFPCYAQINSTGTSTDVKFSTEQLRKDFKVFRGGLEDFHPGLYWYRSKEEMDSIFKGVFESLNRSISEREFFNELSRVNSKIGCGHTRIHFSDETISSKSIKYFPFKLRFIDNKAYCVQSYTSQTVSIRPGYRILSINEWDIDSLLRKSMELLTSDGYNTSNKLFALNNWFHKIYADYFEQPDSYRIQYLDGDSEKKVNKITGISIEEIHKAVQHQTSSNTEGYGNLTLRYIDDPSAAVLSVKHFSNWEENGKNILINDRMQEIFEELDSSGVKNLVVDVRNNGGGKEPWRLLAYLYSEQFVFADKAEYIYSKKSEFYPYRELHSGMKWIEKKWHFNFGSGALKPKRINDSLSVLRGHFMVRPFDPLLPRFDGKVYLITNGGSFSATSLFAAAVKSRGIATLVGEETGGSYYGNTAMLPTIVTLPNTKLKIEIPLVRFLMNVNDIQLFGSGVIPDYVVQQTLADQLINVDTQMNFTLNLIRKNMKNPHNK